jgi:hypothetical protein
MNEAAAAGGRDGPVPKQAAAAADAGALAEQDEHLATSAGQHETMATSQINTDPGATYGTVRYRKAPHGAPYGAPHEHRYYLLHPDTAHHGASVVQPL